ncbi:putative fatty acid elongation protein 3 [Orchesella cincta]|uniref:Elongation of very long chain fatty acids protein n=1 Tax=Orchesella cincta TaxID=48709 RepID=A0A1D2NH11_ORCCI|nr:putative fatty acid elongation protein 3 [Orchesella cincta]
MDQRVTELVYNSKYPMNYTPNYLTLFEFEKFENHEEWRQWMFTNWHYSVYASVIYVALVFYGQWLMKDKSPMKLRKVLTLWNITLALFSAMGFFRSAPELFVSAIQPDGLHRSVCYLYHHMTVCIYCWFAHGAYDPSSRWFCTMNYMVHALMYSYYALRSLQIKLPRSFAMVLTFLQLSQMVVGLVVNFHSYFVLTNGEECARPMSNIYLALAMYFSYFLLFMDFFYKTYLTPSRSKAKAAKTD